MDSMNNRNATGEHVKPNGSPPDGDVETISPADSGSTDGEVLTQELTELPEAINSPAPQKLGCIRSEHRLKQVHSTYLFISFVSLGMIVALHGPTFLDLLIIVNEDIERGTLLFTAGSIGYLTGSLIGGILYDKFNKELTLFAATLLGGVFTIAIPWCPTLLLMCVVSFFRTCFLGALDTGGNALIVKIWGKDVGPYMQAVHFAFGFGGIISPFVAEPFLAPKLTKEGLNSTLPFHNVSFVPGEYSTIDSTFGNSSFNGTTSNVLPDLPQTLVHIPYLIIGIMTAVSAFPYLEMYYTTKDQKERKKADDNTESEKEEVRHIPLTMGVKITFLALWAAFYISYCCVEDTFAGFIMTFVVTHLGWSKTKGARISSVFWISLSAGRLLAVGIAKVLTSWKMLLLDFIFLDVSFLVLFLGVEHSEWFAWVCTVFVAASMASIFPTGMTWMDTRVLKMTGKVASFILICASVGTMANPILVGYLFKEFTPMWFIYLLFIQAVFCSIIFAIASILVHWIHQRWQSRGGHSTERAINQPTDNTLISSSC